MDTYSYKISRLSYIDKTALAEDPYFLHFCTFKPWKSPENDKWIHEQWEDIGIWVFASTSTMLYVSQQLLPEQSREYAAMLANVMSPDAQFFTDVLKQDWAQKYINFGKTPQQKNT